MQSDDMGLVEKPVLWRYCNHDINGDPWPWSYTEREPAPGSYAEIEALYPAAAIERLVAERAEAREALKPFAQIADEIGALLMFGTPEFGIVWRPEYRIGLIYDQDDPDEALVSVAWGDIQRARQALGEP